ncbi:MAG: PTS sugar transporter subunit IIA [Candidatus Krumholzibacteriaceae bacterium]|jgi:two-component system sensor histidine kinase KdpD
MAEDRANSFLRIIRRAQRGRLKVYLGYSAGVGKTYQMLQEGHRLKEQGIDVVIGLLETHGRVDIARLAEGLEVVARRRQDYHGITAEEMDADGVLARKPEVALIDELAHTNLPGSRNPKRYEDVQDILAAGIHVITTLNVQHLESLYNTVEKAVGVKVRERLPDSILAEADQIVDVDLSSEDLRRRLEDGKIYPAERIETALANFFQASNLEKLRELTLRELASQIDLRRREAPPDETDAAPDQVMVCLSSRGPNSEKLLRYASRLAGKLNRNWYAVYVKTRAEEATVIDAQAQRLLSDVLTLAKQLGAMVFTYTGEDIADTILKFAQEYRVGHIVVGSPSPKPLWQRFGKNANIARNLIRSARGVNVILVDTRPEPSPVPARPVAAAGVATAERSPAVTPDTAARPPQLSLSRLLSPRQVVIWDSPVSKETVIRTLAGTVRQESQAGDTEQLFENILEREAQGSTFLNEGAAFPHARVSGLSAPVVALGLTKGSVSDVSTEKPIEIVFLILSPAETPDAQVRVLGLASRAAQSRHLLQALRDTRTPEEAINVIRDWERPEDAAGDGPTGPGGSETI